MAGRQGKGTVAADNGRFAECTVRDRLEPTTCRRWRLELNGRLLCRAYYGVASKLVLDIDKALCFNECALTLPVN